MSKLTTVVLESTFEELRNNGGAELFKVKNEAGTALLWNGTGRDYVTISNAKRALAAITRGAIGNDVSGVIIPTDVGTFDVMYAFTEEA